MATSAVARLLRLRLLPPVMKKGRMSSAAPLILPSATSARAADGFFFSFVKSPATPGAGGVTGGVTEKVACVSGVGGDSGGGGQKKGMGKKGKSPRMKWIVSKTWDLYRKMVRPMEHLNRVGNSIGIIVGAGIYIYAMVFINDEDAVAKEMQNFFKKLSKFIRDDDDEGLTGLTLSLKEICGIPVQMEIIIKQNREIIRKLEKVTEEIDRNKGCGHGESEGEGKQNDGDGRGK